MRRAPVALALGVVAVTVLVASAALLPSCGGGSVFSGGSQTQDGQGETSLQTPLEIVSTGPLPTVFPSCDQRGEPVSYDRAPLGVRATWEVPCDLPGLAQEVLQQYEAQGDLALHHADYLDLLGNVWACAVSGPSWVDLVVIQDEGGDEAYAGSHSQNGPCLVSVMRLGEGATGEDCGRVQGGGT